MNLSIKKTNRYVARKVAAAFSLAELIVVVAIFGIIMSVALANQQELNSSLLVSNLAYEIGLITRETQAYGIGVRALPGVPTAQNFQGAFGMNITLVGGVADKIVVFKDINGDGRYTTNPNPGEAETFSVHQFQNQRGNKIVAMCVLLSSDNLCARGLAGSVDELNVMFKRPNPEASFNAILQSGGGIVQIPGHAIIVVNTPAQKNCRGVVIEMTGQIRVDSAKSAVPVCANN